MGTTFLLLSILSLAHQVPFLSLSFSFISTSHQYIFQEVRAEEQMVLASEALTSYMKAYLSHYRRQKEGLELGEDSEEKRSKDGNNKALVEDDDEGFLDYYYDIGTSEETMPNVNWTMLKPRSSHL